MGAQIRRYQVLGEIVLDFLGPQDQFGKYFTPTDGVIIEADNHTIWVVYQDGKKEESINMIQLIELYFNRGLIKEIQE